MVNPSVGKSRKDVKLNKKEKVWRLRMKGWSQTRIGDHLNMTQANVSIILKEITKEFRERHYQEVDNVKHEQIAQLEYIAEEAMRAWQRSKKDYHETVHIDGGKFAGTTNITRDQYGDPRLLSVAIKAKEDIRKILGLNLKVDDPNEGDEEEKQITRYSIPLEKPIDSDDLIAVGDVEE